MSVECCGKVLETPYCPECGKKLNEYFMGIHGLLQHVDNRAKNLAAAMEDTPHGDEYDRKGKVLAKWQGWQTALKELMDK